MIEIVARSRCGKDFAGEASLAGTKRATDGGPNPTGGAVRFVQMEPGDGPWETKGSGIIKLPVSIRRTNLLANLRHRPNGSRDRGRLRISTSLFAIAFCDAL